MRHLGTALIALGLLLLGYAGLWQLGLAPGSRLSLPEPVALQRDRGDAAPANAARPAAPLDPAHPETTAAPPAAPDTAASANPDSAPPLDARRPMSLDPELAHAADAPTTVPAPESAIPTAAGRGAAHDPSAVVIEPPPPAAAGAAAPDGSTLRTQAPPAPAAPPVALPLLAPDAVDRRADAHLPPPGYAVRLSIPAIKLDTPVRQGGIVQDAAGQPVWETLPFVAVHYGDLTALVGARGNAVIAGHVATLREGNVFRFLYQVDLDDLIQVWDERGQEHDFRVTGVKLVAPSDVSVMNRTPDPTLTLITCGGTFDPVKREFSDRLIVVAKPT